MEKEGLRSISHDTHKWKCENDKFKLSWKFVRDILLLQLCAIELKVMNFIRNSIKNKYHLYNETDSLHEDSHDSFQYTPNFWRTVSHYHFHKSHLQFFLEIPPTIYPFLILLIFQFHCIYVKSSGEYRVLECELYWSVRVWSQSCLVP